MFSRHHVMANSGAPSRAPWRRQQRAGKALPDPTHGGSAFSFRGLAIGAVLLVPVGGVDCGEPSVATGLAVRPDVAGEDDQHQVNDRGGRNHQ